MPELRINIDKETYDKLKEYARSDERSATQYISRLLRQAAGTLTPTSTSLTPFLNSPSIPTEINGHKIKNITFAHEKSEQILSPEEEELKQQKLSLQKDKILKDREKKWYERAKEVMKDYWNDNRCQNFAKDRIYGNNIYHDFGPDDPVAIAPEPDDSRLEEILKYELEDEISEIKREQEAQEERLAYKRVTDAVDKNINPPKNEYYDKIKDYYYTCSELGSLEELLTRLYLAGRVTDEILNYVKDYHQMNIFYALDIPVTHDLTDDEWRELLSNLIISK